MTPPCVTVVFLAFFAIVGVSSELACSGREVCDDVVSMMQTSTSYRSNRNVEKTPVLHDETSMLQFREDLVPDLEHSFEGKVPIEWVHVPKSGTSFALTLLTIPGVCANLPQDLEVVNSAINTFSVPPSWGCDTSIVDTERGRMGHWGIELLPQGGFEEAKGRFMIMMRQPEQRLLSGMLFTTTDMGWNQSIDVFKEGKSGCITKMLTRGAKNNCEDFLPPTRAEVEEAKYRLRSGFSFVGMTEQWNLSICLFNVMFNQKCRSIQFQDSRPTNGTTQVTYDTAILEGFRDPYDNEVFDVGMEIFQEHLRRYNVSESSCELCWREAAVVS